MDTSPVVYPQTLLAEELFPISAPRHSGTSSVFPYNTLSFSAATLPPTVASVVVSWTSLTQDA